MEKLIGKNFYKLVYSQQTLDHVVVSHIARWRGRPRTRV